MRPDDREPGPQPLEATVSLRTNEGIRDADLGGIRLTRKAASEAQGTKAVQALLRGRLRLASLLVTCVFAVAGCLAIVNIALNYGAVGPRVWQGIAFFSGLSVVLAALTAFLWSRWRHSLSQLRASELALVGIFALGCVWKQLNYLDAASDLARRFGDSGTTILATYLPFHWPAFAPSGRPTSVMPFRICQVSSSILVSTILRMP